jgi:uncharacterized integral membrane protein
MERSGGLQEGAKRRGWRPWAFGIALILVIIIVAQNSQKVPVDILFIHTTMPLIIALLVAAVLGAVIGYVGPVVRRHRRGD